MSLSLSRPTLRTARSRPASGGAPTPKTTPPPAAPNHPPVEPGIPALFGGTPGLVAMTCLCVVLYGYTAHLDRIADEAEADAAARKAEREERRTQAAELKQATAAGRQEVREQAIAAIAFRHKKLAFWDECAAGGLAGAAAKAESLRSEIAELECGLPPAN